MPLTASQREVRLRVLGRMSHNGSKLDGPHAVDGSQLEVGVEVRSIKVDPNRILVRNRRRTDLDLAPDQSSVFS